MYENENILFCWCIYKLFPHTHLVPPGRPSGWTASKPNSYRAEFVNPTKQFNMSALNADWVSLGTNIFWQLIEICLQFKFSLRYIEIENVYHHGARLYIQYFYPQTSLLQIWCNIIISLLCSACHRIYLGLIFRQSS